MVAPSRLCSQAAAGTWVRAELSDNGKTLTMPLNQHIIFYDDEGYGLIIAWINVGIDENGNIQATPDLDIQEATFTIDDDGVISLVGSSGDVEAFECSGLGLIYDDDFTWTTYADWESVYTPFDATPVELPDDAVLEDYSMSYVDSYGSAGGKMIKVAMMDNDVYVQGFSSMVPDGVMKGTLNGDKVTFPSDQYIGIGSSLFLNMAGIDADYNLLDNLEFDYDATTRTMLSLPPTLTMLLPPPILRSLNLLTMASSTATTMARSMCRQLTPRATSSIPTTCTIASTLMTTSCSPSVPTSIPMLKSS